MLKEGLTALMTLNVWGGTIIEKIDVPQMCDNSIPTNCIFNMQAVRVEDPHGKNGLVVPAVGLFPALKVGDQFYCTYDTCYGFFDIKSWKAFNTQMGQPQNLILPKP